MAEPAIFGDTSIAPVNGASLACRDAGQGDPVVLVHGSASDLRTWEGTVAAMSGSHRMISYSRRYARPNAAIPEGADDPMDVHVEDLAALGAQLDASPAHWVGHSWGGFVCLLAAIRYPDRVRRLVLLEPPVLSLFVSTPPRPSELLKTFFRSPATAAAIVRFGATAAGPATKAYRRGDDETAFEIFGRGVLGDEAFGRLSPERRQQAWDNVAVDKAQLLGAGFPPLADDEVRQVAAPTLLLHGAKSPAFLRRLSDRLGALLPDVVRVEVPDASHLMHEDNPDAVHAAIRSFLA